MGVESVESDKNKIDAIFGDDRKFITKSQELLSQLFGIPSYFTK